MPSVAFQVDLRLLSLQVLQMSLGEVVRELLLLDKRDRVDVLELPLPIPVLVEQVVVAPQLLGDFAHQVQVLLRQESRNSDLTRPMVENLDPDEPLPGHHCLHEPKVEAPNHDDAENDREGRHYDPVLYIIDTEDRAVDTIVDAIVVLVLNSILVGLVLRSVPVVLLQERVE